MQNYISEKRLDHCLSVAKLAYEIAKSNKLDHPHRYYAAALFHDARVEKAVYPVQYKGK